MPHSPNRLLASLTADEYRSVEPRLHTIRLSNGSTLPYSHRGHVYFPASGVVSLLSRMSDSTTIEIASVGCEGAVGMPLVADQLDAITYQQVSNGTVQYMSRHVFETCCRETTLGRVVNQFCVVFMQSVMQFIACNRMHPLHARCARWLMMTYERVGRARFELTQPFLALVMGISPRDLSGLMQKFARQGLLEYDASSVTVLDPIALRQRACGCYAVLRKYARMDVVSPPDREPSSATVLTMRPLTVCTICGLTRGHPHASHMDCLRALDAELHTLLGRAREITKVRGQIAVESMKKYDKFRLDRPS